MADVPEILRSLFDGLHSPCSSPEPEPVDLEAMEDAIEEYMKVFMERREQYGNHLLKSPGYYRAALRVKLERAINDIDAGRKMKRDTVIDMAIYLLMILSKRHADARLNDTTSDHHQ